MKEAVSVLNISKAYRRGKNTVNALTDVSLSVKQGEIFGLLGPNGAGKTSLISILVGISEPEKGSAKIFGKDCVKESKEVQKNINVVSGFSGAPYHLSVEQCLIYYSMLYSVKDAKPKIESFLKKLNIYESRDKTVDDLSSGMRQRYLIAKGLLNDPELLILDEPTVGLDVESAISVREIIKDLNKQGRTILLTTHNMFEAQELCDRVAFINHGRIMATGSPNALRTKILETRTVEIHCSNENEVVDILKSLGGVNALVKSPQIVHVNVDRYERMKDIMKMLAKCECEIYSINELEPTFEEIYLKFVNSGEEHV
ncbi:ABC transporter ATP-binding protein [Candidatus Micrarchaeota archaeon]|nr:ABC transporter ATP-binding protein [Candidatus Micrarchaeota archaeon]